MTQAATKPVFRYQKVRRGMSQRQWRDLGLFYLFISPWVFGFLCLLLFPLIWGLYLSLTNYSGWSFASMKFIGLDNYIRVWKDMDAWEGFFRTAVITVVGVPVGIVGGLAIAVLLNQKVKGLRLFRTLYYLPSVVPGVAAIVIWKSIYDRNNGLLNALLDFFRRGTVINWISDYSNLALIVMGLWGLGGGMIIYLAALQGVPTELKEAANIDGASSWQSFRLVTVPLISPVLFFQLIMGIINYLQLLVPAMLLTNEAVNNFDRFGLGGVPPANRLYMIHLYEQTFFYQRYGYGLALAWIIFVIVLIFSLLVIKSQRYWVHYEVDVTARGDN